MKKLIFILVVTLSPFLAQSYPAQSELFGLNKSMIQFTHLKKLLRIPLDPWIKQRIHSQINEFTKQFDGPTDEYMISFIHDRIYNQKGNGHTSTPRRNSLLLNCPPSLEGGDPGQPPSLR